VTPSYKLREISEFAASVLFYNKVPILNDALDSYLPIKLSYYLSMID